MFRRYWSILLVPVIAFVMGGCAANGKVTDFDRSTTSLSKMKLSDSGKLKIFDGNAVREVGLKKIKSLRIENDITTTYNRELFFRAEIVFRDGTMIGSLKKKQKKAYVAVNYYLTGNAGGGPYSILLSNVYKLEIAY